MRQALALLLLLVIDGCCCGRCGSLEKESYAKVPLTPKEARALEKDGAVVTVTRQTRTSGGGGCGHAAICVIFLPIMLYDAAFPEKWDEVVVTKDGVVTLFASYDSSGALIHAQHLVDGELRETRSIELKVLGKQAYVDSAKLIALEDGGVRRELLLLSSQHDFIGDERKLLEREKDPQKRAAAINEARLLLEDEGLAFARERLSSATEDDQTKAEVLKLGCGTPEFEPLIPEAQKNPGPWTKTQLARCVTGPAHDALVLELAEAACDAKTPRPLMKEFALVVAFEPMNQAALRAIQAQCPEGPNRTALALWLKVPVQQKELDALLSSDLGFDQHPYLQTSDALQRAALLKLAIANDDADASFARLVDGKTVLEPELLEALAGWYVKPKGLLTTGPRAKALELFSLAAKAPDGASRTKAARAALTRSQNEPLFGAALVVLGERNRIPTISAALIPPVHSGSPVTEKDLVSYGLELAGCSHDELRAAANEKKTPKCLGGAP